MPSSLKISECTDLTSAGGVKPPYQIHEQYNGKATESQLKVYSVYNKQA